MKKHLLLGLLAFAIISCDNQESNDSAGCGTTTVKYVYNGIEYAMEMRELSDGRVAIGKGNGEICILEVGNNIKINTILKGHEKSVNSMTTIPYSSSRLSKYFPTSN